MDKLNQIQTPSMQNQFVQNLKPDNQVQGFGETLKQALQEVNAAQQQSEKLTNQLVSGEVKDIHDVMIASQKASLSLQLTTQVRNKVVEAYQELMRMQV